MQSRDRLAHHEQELSKTAMNATEQALRRQEAQQERASQHREEMFHQFYAEKMQQEAQRIERHERALRHDLE
eukprot:2333639-Pyramimonas_sp.AAC.1